MKNLKKLIAVAMALVMCLSITVIGASAATLTNEHLTDNGKVWYIAGNPLDNKGTEDPDDDVVEGTYTVTIPEYIKSAPMDGTPETQEVVATEVLLLPEEVLSISCKYSGELTLREDNDVKLGYKMQNEGVDFATGDVVLTAEAGDPTATYDTSIGSILTAAPLFAGVYTDTVTFTSSVA